MVHIYVHKCTIMKFLGPIYKQQSCYPMPCTTYTCIFTTLHTQKCNTDQIQHTAVYARSIS